VKIYGSVGVAWAVDEALSVRAIEGAASMTTVRVSTWTEFIGAPLT
jgi:hypothetical protein